MAIKSFAEFTEMHTSFLQEIGNMGAGNAATSLSDMISSPTDISVPSVKILPTAEASKLVDMLCGRTVSYLITLKGDLKGSILFVIPLQFIERLVSTYFPGITIAAKEDMDEMATSMTREMVNLVAAAYANNFSLLSGMTVDINVPEGVSAPSAKIMSVNTSELMNACFINTSIEICDCKKSFNVIFFPELETVQDFMGRLGIPT